jgi:hypothetical protein
MKFQFFKIIIYNLIFLKIGQVLNQKLILDKEQTLGSPICLKINLNNKH